LSVVLHLVLLLLLPLSAVRSLLSARVHLLPPLNGILALTPLPPVAGSHGSARGRGGSRDGGPVPRAAGRPLGGAAAPRARATRFTILLSPLAPTTTHSKFFALSSSDSSRFLLSNSLVISASSFLCSRVRSGTIATSQYCVFRSCLALSSRSSFSHSPAKSPVVGNYRK
jgi:hypothetical protein